MDQDKALSNRIAVLRAEHKMTQKELAEKSGVSRQTIISIEKNRYTPSLTLAFDIANVFGVGIEKVFQYKEEK
ncbi:helix-turn-helix transcriptional regulator [Oceanobacillus chungangensis]|uniref:Transcriptional regulator n=1 Tax=Oceanobacillus chungangensis TaxID=1229152 RepID=A0A3D8PQ70_9BACI|nr:helix-turn-helix transcriptional regulator [Oceanobacillus chungangensis]RDW17697.1 transcriptional regulator [Oceanobacillus chungangensis]